MATFRVGVGSFNIQDGAVGFGTDTDGLGNLRVKGITKTTGSIVSGASTLTRYSGFAADNINQLENITHTSEVGTIGDIVVGVGTSVIISSGSTVTVGTVESVSIGTHFSPPVGGIEERGDNFIEGMMRFNTDLNTMEFYNGNEWRQFTYVVDFQNSPGSQDRGIFCGGYAPTTPSISFVNVSTKGNAVDFGHLEVPIMYGGGCSTGTRGVFGGGRGPAPSYTKYNVIQYLTIASTGNTIDFGDLTDARRRVDATSSSTRGLWGSADSTPSTKNIIDYVELNTLGNALDFGDMTDDAYSRGALSSPTRAVWFGGSDSFPTITNMEFVTIASKGNGVIFGDMTEARTNCAGGGFSNGVRGVIAAGYGKGPAYTLNEIIDTITIASEGDAIDFGSLVEKTRDYNGAQNLVRGLIAGGSNPSSYINAISAISLTTSGSSEDFGDLMEAAKALVGLSGSHGGLGGF